MVGFSFKETPKRDIFQLLLWDTKEKRKGKKRKVFFFKERKERKKIECEKIMKREVPVRES